MNSLHFDRFEQALQSGRRSLASAALKEFIESFASLEEKAAWTRWYFENRTTRTIRYELYEQIIFPVLLAGYQHSDPWSLQYLEHTAQNLYRSKKLWDQVDNKTGHELAKQWLALCPDNVAARECVLKHQLTWFRYCLHEWPRGILYGVNGAKPNECKAILEEIELAKHLDVNCKHSEFFADFEKKVKTYSNRIGRSSKDPNQ